MLGHTLELNRTFINGWYRKRKCKMLGPRDNHDDSQVMQHSSMRSALKRFVRSAWNILVSLVINARDVYGSGRIQL
jgi:hypothetical protein